MKDREEISARPISVLYCAMADGMFTPLSTDNRSWPAVKWNWNFSAAHISLASIWMWMLDVWSLIFALVRSCDCRALSKTNGGDSEDGDDDDAYDGAAA